MLCSGCRENTVAAGEDICARCLPAADPSAPAASHPATVGASQQAASDPAASPPAAADTRVRAPQAPPAPGLRPVVQAPVAPGPLSVLRSPVGLGHAVSVLLLLVAVGEIAAAVAALNLRRLMDLATVGYSEEDAELADRLLLITSVFQVALYVATVVVFIVWFHRVRSNADVFAPGTLERGRGWAIGGWFVPVAGLWIPRGIAVEVWRASRTDPFAPDRHEPHTLVNVWWVGFVVATVFTRYADRAYDDAGTPEQIISAVDRLLVGNGLQIVAAVLAVLFVRRLTHMQHTNASKGAGRTVAV
ncbi:UNVERIFIED_CONTAM: heme/copper-type cytochrome/quinol oxidase subunit 2 [Streptomyces graminofaciens]